MPNKYSIGDIPFFTVWSGDTLTFQVETKLGAGARFSQSAVTAPAGSVTIDEKSGLFSFKPAPTDTEEIAIWISAKVGDKEEKQKVSITSLPRLSSEFNVIAADAPTPDPTSGSYIRVSEEDAGLAVFNNIDPKEAKILTKKVVISGMTVVFDPRGKNFPLFATYSSRKDISELSICADEVIIRGQLKLPSTKLTINARSLAFQDVGNDPACIDTTPLSVELAGDGDEGLKGAAAGDIHLYVKNIAMPGAAVRFIGKGGKGQPARLGQKGADGKSIGEWGGRDEFPTYWGGKETLDWGPEKRSKLQSGQKPTYSKVVGTYEIWGDTTHDRDFEFGQTEWPGDGHPPVTKPGMPGQGGNGATVYSSFSDQLKGHVRQEAGEIGAMAKDIKAAEPGQPQNSCHVKCTFWGPALPGTRGEGDGILNFKTDFKVTESHTSKGYPEVKAPGPNPNTAKGKEGALLALDRKIDGSWVHPLAAQALLMYMRDLFLSGGGPALRPRIDEYLKAMAAAESAGPAPLEFAGLAVELTSLARRIDSPFDYFGNPAGWAPMLSFEANLTLYEHEVGDAIRTLFLSYWIENNQTSKEKAATGLQKLNERLKAESAQALKDYNAGSEKLVNLGERHDSIRVQIDGLLGDLKALEAKLRAAAEGDLQLQHIIRSSGKILGGALQLIPVGQPALGAVGSGLTVLSDIDLSKPLDTGPKLAAALWETDLIQKKLKPKVQDLAKSFFGITSEDKDDDSKDDDKDFKKDVAKKQLEEKVKKFLEKEKEAKEQITKALGNFSVPKSEIDAELKRIKAACPEYTKLADKIKTLGEEQATFAEEMLTVSQVLDEAGATIMKNALAEIEVRAQLKLTFDQLNNEAWQYVRAMGQRARDRLTKYQYYLVKSYNYLMLRALPDVDFSSQHMFDAFANMLKSSPDGMLTSKQFEALLPVFESQLKQITGKIIDWYQEHPPKRGAAFGVSLSPEQIKTLNDERSVTINLLEMGYLDLTQEDIRITDIKTTVAQVQEPPAKESANVNLYFKHSGVSNIRRGGKLFLFRTGDYSHLSDDGQQSYRDDHMFWGTAIKYEDGKPTLTPMRPDPSEQSLMQYLLKDKGKSSEPLKQYQPSAWADITIQRSATPASFEGRLDSLTLDVSCVFYPVMNELFTLQVRSTGGVQPYIRCDTTDLNGRSDGLGGFLRTFSVSKTKRIKLTAAAGFGGLAFVGWRTSRKQESGPNKSAPLFPLLTPEAAAQMGETEDLIKERELVIDLKPADYRSVEAVYLPQAQAASHGKSERKVEGAPS